MTRMIGYARVSTDEQAREGLSLEAQRARITAHCIAQGWELVGIEVDEGASASTLARDGLSRARDAIGRGAASGLVVTKLDRLTRSVRDLVALRGDGMGSAWALVSLAESVDTSTATGRMFLTLVVTFAEWEREQTAERTKETLRHARSQGQPLGAVPYGWTRLKVERGENRRRVGARGRLVPDEQQQNWLAAMRAWRDSGWGYERVATELNALGVRTARGKRGAWTATSVKRALAYTPAVKAA